MTLLPMGRPRTRSPRTPALVGWLILLVTVAVRPSPADAAETDSLYPLSARLTFTSPVQRRCGIGEIAAGLEVIPAVEQRLHEVLEREVLRMFRIPAADTRPDLEIDISSACAGIREIGEGTFAAVEIRATVSAPGAGEIARVSSHGDSPIFGPDWSVVAGERAAGDAASGFAAAFANSDPIVSWLLARKLEPIGSTVAWPARGPWVAFGDLGGGAMLGSGEQTAPGLLAQFGVSNRWFVVQGVLGTWSAPFQGAPSGATSDTRVAANLRVYDAGIEGGPSVRLGRSVELRGGVGLHGLFGGADRAQATFAHASPSLFASIQSSIFPTRTGTRVRYGIEFRSYFKTTVGLEPLSRTLPAAGTYLGVYIGFERSNPGSRP
jgi:hypothetical protein